MSGTFTMRNDGAAGGEDTLHWAAYASADMALGGDYLLARGSQAGGLTAATSLAVPFGGMWPSTPGSWYLIVTLSADDDVDQSAASNTAVSAATVTTTGPAPANVDYIVTSVTNTGGFTAGDPLTGSFTVPEQPRRPGQCHGLLDSIHLFEQHAGDRDRSCHRFRVRAMAARVDDVGPRRLRGHVACPGRHVVPHRLRVRNRRESTRPTTKGRLDRRSPRTRRR